MGKIDELTAANMDVVLEEVCRELPHGGTMNVASISRKSSCRA
jgi:hypothetical protein